MKNRITLGRKGYVRLLLPASLLAMSLTAMQGCMDTGSLFDSSTQENARSRGAPAAPEAKPVGIPPIADTGMACIQILVCGSDGKLYPDPCAAAAAKVEYSPDLAACEEVATAPEVCTAEYAPVCGVNGKSYSNACNAAMNRVKVGHSGACN